MTLLQGTFPDENTWDLIDKLLNSIIESEYFLDCIFKHFWARIWKAFLSMINYWTLSAVEYRAISTINQERFKTFFENIDFSKVSLDTWIQTTQEQQSAMAMEFQAEIISHITRYKIFDDFKNDDFWEKYSLIAWKQGFKVFQSLNNGKIYLKLWNDFLPEEILTKAIIDPPEYIYFPWVDSIFIYSNKTWEILELQWELEEVYEVSSWTILQVVYPNWDTPKKRKLYFVEQDISHTLNIEKSFWEIHDVVEQDGRIYCVETTLNTYNWYAWWREVTKAERVVRIIDIISWKIASETPWYYYRTLSFEEATIIETLQRNKIPENNNCNEFTLHLTKLSLKWWEQLPPLTDYKEYITENDQIFVTTLWWNRLILSFITMIVEPYSNIREVHMLDDWLMIEFTREWKTHYFKSKEFLELNW